MLHRRAARWFADHGDVAEAIGHAIASGDGPLSGRLVAAHWRQPFNAGQLETVRMWLDALPAELVAADASLSAARVWVALDTGRLEEVGAALDTAETSVPPDTQLMVLRALQMYKAGDVGGAAARLREISPSAEDPFIATVHRLVQGISWMWLGDTGRAGELLVEAARRAEDDGNRLAYIYAEGCATPAVASVPRTRPAGPRWSPTSSCAPPTAAPRETGHDATGLFVTPGRVAGRNWHDCFDWQRRLRI